MTGKRYDLIIQGVWDNIEDYELGWEEIVDLLNENEQLKETINNLTKGENYLKRKEKIIELQKENEELKKDVDYWKQVASQYSNELNVFKHCKEHKTKCKNIHWSSD